MHTSVHQCNVCRCIYVLSSPQAFPGFYITLWLQTYLKPRCKMGGGGWERGYICAWCKPVTTWHNLLPPGADSVRFKAEVNFDGREVARLHTDRLDLEKALKVQPRAHNARTFYARRVRGALGAAKCILSHDNLYVHILVTRGWRFPLFVEGLYKWPVA